MRTTTDRWKPSRYGPGRKLYCSPACGGRCTYEAYLLAKSNAKYLAASLGEPWEPVVHENLGWYYYALLKIEDSPVSAHHYKGGERPNWTASDGHFIGRSDKSAADAFAGYLRNIDVAMEDLQYKREAIDLAVKGG